MSEDSLEHDPSGDVWEQHAAGPKRDRKSDAEVRDAIRREQHGEYDEDGNFRESIWTDAG